MGTLSAREIAECHGKSLPISFRNDTFYENEKQFGSLRSRLTWLNKKCIASILGEWPFEARISLTKFMPKLLTCDFNPEMSMSATTNANGTSLIVEGRFHTSNDLGVLKWSSDNELGKPEFKFPENQMANYDFNNIVLEFDYEIEGELPLLYEDAAPSLTVTLIDNTQHKVRLWLYDTKRPVDNWEFAHRPAAALEDEDLVVDIEAGDIDAPDTDFEEKYARKWTWPQEQRQPEYQLGNSGHIRLNFNNLCSGQSKFVKNPSAPNETKEQDEAYWMESPEWKKIEPDKIKYVQWEFRPRDQAQEPDGQWFRISFHNWHVTGPNFVRGMPSPLPYNPTLLAHNYATIYQSTPQWLIEQGHILGFRNSINLFVEETQINGDTSKSVLNDGFRTWLVNYLRVAKSFHFTQITVSLSLENAAAPESQTFHQRLTNELLILQNKFDLDISVQLT